MNKYTRIAAVTAAVLASATACYAQSSPMDMNNGAKADNSRNNKTDPTNQAATADDQKNNSDDVMLTKQIRASIIADKSLSTYAHNVKIVSANGNVTLNGVVRSQAEKDSVASKAQMLVKHGNLTNDLKIAPAQ